MAVKRSKIHDYEREAEWTQTGGTLSDKTAYKEYGLTEAEVIHAIRAGKLQFRQGSVFGNPFFRLLRSEVEALVKKKHGDKFVKTSRIKSELSRINSKLKTLRRQMSALEKNKSALQKDLSRIEQP